MNLNQLVRYLPDEDEDIPVAFWNGDKSRLWIMSLSITTSYLPSVGGIGGGASVSVKRKSQNLKLIRKLWSFNKFYIISFLR